MGRIIDRRRVMGGNTDAPYVTIPYVTDGCIGMWDAEWNSGFGVHSPNATTWKDLSSAGEDLSMRQGEGYFTWESNRLYCLGKGYVASLPYMYEEFQTIECVFSIDDIAHDGTLCMQMLVWADNVKGVMANAYNSLTTASIEFSNGGYGAINISDVSEFNGKKYNVTGIFNSINSIKLVKAFSNSIQRSLVTCTNGATGNFFTIGGQSIDSRIVKGYIYTVRLYNRALSDEEIIHNWNIDNSRFNIL